MSGARGSEAHWSNNSSPGESDQSNSGSPSALMANRNEKQNIFDFPKQVKIIFKLD